MKKCSRCKNQLDSGIVQEMKVFVCSFCNFSLAVLTAKNKSVE